MGCGFAGKLGADIVQISERHTGKNVRLKVVDHAVKDVGWDLNVFAVEASFVIDVNAELFPVLADDVKDNVILRDQVVLFTWEGDNTVIEIFGATITILLNVTIRSNLVGFVDIQFSAGLFVWHDSQEVAVAVGVLGHGFGAEISLLGGVEPTLVVLDGRFLFGRVEKVEGKGDGFRTIRIDGLDGHRGQNTFAGIDFTVTRKDVTGIGELDNNAVLKLLGSGIRLKDDSSGKCILRSI